MNEFKKIVQITIMSFLLIFLIPRPAYAYIGPGSITFVFQILAGFLVGGVAMLIMSWKKIRNRLFKNKSK
jgi:ABC-type transport system involved in multi-copper enzyme maturation permease subunit